METIVQEYLPALPPLVIGGVAFLVGIVFALRERRQNQGRRHLRDLEQVQQELDLERPGSRRSRTAG
jgi:hypothetical protein